MQAKSVVREAIQRIALSLTFAGAAFVVACGGSSEKAAGDTAQSATSSAQTASGPAPNAKVTDVRIGTKMDSSRQVTRQTDIFTPTDTLFAAVHILGAGPNTQVTGRWTFQDGKTVDEQKQPVTPPNDAWTGFRSVKSGGWPVGTYTFHVLLNGQEVEKRDVMVK